MPVAAVESTTAAVLVPFVAPEGTLQSRLEAYLEWAVGVARCRQIFVSDEEGLVLLEQESDGELIAVSSSFMTVLDRIRSCLGSETPGVMALDIDSEQVLHLMQVKSNLGRFNLGCVVSEPLPRAVVESLKGGLEAIFASEEAVFAVEQTS